MSSAHPEYLLLLSLLGAITAALLGIHALFRRRTVEGATAFAACMVGVSIWSLGYALELIAPTLSEKLLWARVEYIGIVTVPLMWFIFIVQYTGLGARLTRWQALLLGAIPALTVLMVWTNDLHHLHWRTSALRTEGVLLPVLSHSYGPVFWIHTAYSYSLLVVAFVLLVLAVRNTSRPHRTPLVTLLIASFIPWLANGMTVFKIDFGLPAFSGLDLAPLAFSFSGLLAAWGIFGLRMLDIAPVARQLVVEGMHDAVFVVDTSDRLVDLNPAAAQLWGRPAAEMLGQPIETLLARRQELFQRFKDILEAHVEVALDVRGEMRHFDMHIAPLRGPGEVLRGRVVTLHDITLLKQAEQALRRRDVIMEVLAYASEQLLLYPPPQAMPQLLERLGQAAGVSRVYIFENHSAPDGTLLTSQRYEWVAPGQTPQIDNPALQNFPYVAEGFQRWVEVLGAGQPLYGLVREFPASERPVLEAQDIRSLLVVPIFSEGQWWGFLGFDECTQDRFWSTAEIEALRSVANILGAAFARQRIAAAEREQRALAEALRDTAAALSSTLDRDVMFDRILESVGRVVPHDAANIMLIEKGVARIVRTRGYEGRADEQALHALRFVVDETPNLRTMVETGEPFIIPDVRQYPGWLPVETTAWIKSYMGVPIHREGKVIGFLNLDSSEVGLYTPEHAERLKAFAHQAATALRNAELYAESQYHIRQLALLNEITRIGTATLDLDELLETLVQTAARIIGGDGCFITFWDAERKRTLPMASPVIPSEEYRRIEVAPDEVTLTASVLKVGHPLPIEDVFNTPYMSRSIAERFPEKSVLALPLRAAGRDIGALLIAFMETHHFTEEEITWAQQAADLIALAIARAQAYADLIEHNRELDAFSYTAAHDIKAPLSVALGYMALFKEAYGDQLTDEARIIVEQTDLALSKMLQIVESLLMLARVRSATQAAEPVAMEAVIRAALERYKATIAARNIHVDLQPPFPPVLGYGPWLEEVMANLIGNAAKFAGAREGEQPCILIRAVPQDHTVRYEVQDNGPGIAPEDQQRIFEMFTRLRGGPAEGAGLGLSIVRRIIKKLGGEVGVESEVGKGSTFWFTLPTAPLSAPAPTAE